MNIQFSSFIATTVDGFIARPNGQLDWLNQATNKNNQQDFGYHQFNAAVTSVVMGRRTFEKVASFANWPFDRQRVVILSRKMKQAPPDLEDKVSFFNGKIEQLAVELQTVGGGKVYVDGGVTIQSFIQAKILDDITITQVPILIGKGIPLFDNIRDDVRLELLQSKAYDNGFVQSKYRINYGSGKFFD